MPEDLCACDQSAPVDLDTWRAEAGEAIALCAYPPTAPFPITATVSTMAAAARTGWPRDAARVGVLCAEVERLSAEVARERGRADEVLCDDTSLANTAQRLHAEVATLRAALLDAADGWDAARKSATPPRRADAETIARLRAIAAGSAPAKEPTR